MRQPSQNPRPTTGKLRRTAALSGLTAFLLAGSLPDLRAQEVAGKPPKNWKQSIAAGLTMSRGNSRNVLGTISYDGARKWEADELLLNAAGGYGKSTTGGLTKKTDDYFRGSAQWNHTLSGDFYSGLKVDIAHDDLADLYYRFKVSPLLGYHFINRDDLVLSGEVGPTYVKEKQGGKNRDYLAARLGERLTWAINERAKLWQSLEVLPQVDDINNTIFIGEIGIDTAITEAWSLRVVFQDTYDNEPAPGLQKNDAKIIAGIAYKF